MPEELKALIRNLVENIEGLTGELEILNETQKRQTLAYQKLAKEQKRSKKANIILGCAVLGIILLGSVFFIDLTHRRANIQRQIGNLACLAWQSAPSDQKDTDFFRTINDNYDCVHHPVPLSKGFAPRPTPTVTATAIRTRVKVTPGPTTTSTVQATITATAISTVTVHSTSTVTVSGPTRTQTVTKTVTPPVCAIIPLC